MRTSERESVAKPRFHTTHKHTNPRTLHPPAHLVGNPLHTSNTLATHEQHASNTLHPPAHLVGNPLRGTPAQQVPPRQCLAGAECPCCVEARACVRVCVCVCVCACVRACVRESARARAVCTHNPSLFASPRFPGSGSGSQPLSSAGGTPRLHALAGVTQRASWRIIPGKSGK